MKFDNNYDLDSLDADLFNNFNADYESEEHELVLDQIGSEPIDLEELGDWNDELDAVE